MAVGRKEVSHGQDSRWIPFGIEVPGRPSEGGIEAEGDEQAVPVRPRPRMRTFMGTLRVQLRRLMSVSVVKMSVIGRGEYFAEKAILNELIIER